ncbi:MAG: hypothetical protein HYZ13_09220 [Acidobacteria bacterium]|nr:hypothetical protein [Acidobacteriota bacterium]
MPGLVGVTVQGAYVVRPGVYSLIDASEMVPSRPGPGGIVAALASSDGGDPNLVYEFRTFQEAAAVLRGGSGLSLMARIFRPHSELPGASLVRFIRVGSPSQAELETTGLRFISRDYGRHTNGIALTIESTEQEDRTPRTWAITVEKPADGYRRRYTLGKALWVASSAAEGRLTFDHVAQVAQLWENDDLAATFEYPTDQATLVNLAAWLSSRPGWSARVQGDPALPVRCLDDPPFWEASPINGSGTELLAQQGALVWLLERQDLVLRAEPRPDFPPALAAFSERGPKRKPEWEDWTRYGALSPCPQTYLSGGSGVAADLLAPSDWVEPLVRLLAVEANHLFVASSDPAVHALALQHCQDAASARRKRWRILYAGGGPLEAEEDALAAAQDLDGPVVYAWNGTTVRNPLTGLPEQFGGIGAAAQLCGAAAGSFESEPLTNKPLQSEGLEVPAPNDTTLERLLLGGVTPLAPDPVTGRATIVQALTTYQGGANVAFRKLQGLRIQHAIYRMWQRVLSRFVGYPLDLVTGRLIRGAASGALDQVVRTPQNPGGFLTPGFKEGKEIPAWQNLQVVGDGVDAWILTVEVHPVGETDYILTTTKLTPVQILL